jgi:hypothetical protein
MKLASVGNGGEGRRALVVFSGRADLAWLRLLKRGFRHCFVVLDFGDRWVMLNPLSHYTDVEVFAGLAAEDLAAGFRRQGLTVVAARTMRPKPRPAPWRPHTCVEAVIRILGMRAPWVLTPWQLYRYLVFRKKNLT